MAEGLHIGVSARKHSSDGPAGRQDVSNLDLYSQDRAQAVPGIGGCTPSRERWPTDVGQGVVEVEFLWLQ